MRHTIVLGVVLSQLAVASLAFAEDGATPVPSAVETQTTQTTTAPPVASPPPAATSSTTTTQAAVDVPLAQPAPMQASQSGGGESTTYVNRPLLVTGLLLFGASYAPAIGVAAESNRPSDNPNLYVPVVGPWLDLGQRDCSAARPCVSESGNKALLIADGIGQGLGTLAVLTSFFVPEKKSRHWFIVGNDSFHAAPTVGAGTYGMAAAGHF